MDKAYARVDGVREAMRPEFMLASYPLISGMLIYAGFMAWKYHKKLHIVVVVFILCCGARDRCIRIGEVYGQKTLSQLSTLKICSAFRLSQVRKFSGKKELLASWLILNRPSFCQFATSISFNRGTAVEVVRRQKMFDIISMQSQICALLNSLNKNNECSVDDVQMMCYVHMVMVRLSCSDKPASSGS